MTVNAALPADIADDRGAVLTFIVPAPSGCDLACSFCYIRQRGEDRSATLLRPDDYARFIREAAAAGPVAAICIQGYEPLLDDAWPWTLSILSTGQWLGIPTSLVTNGTHLAKRVADLRQLRIGRVAVSLDGADAASHERSRRVAGAFHATLAGLEAAVAGFAPTTELAVTSVLLPKRRAQLDAMPKLLQSLGIRRWVINALLQVSQDSSQLGGPAGPRAAIFRDLLALDRAARAAGIELTVDDEFGRLAEADQALTPPEIFALRIKRLQRPDGIIRLVPDGRYSTGPALLQRLPDDAPRWQPGQSHAATLLAP